MEARELRIGNLTDKGVVKNFYQSGIHVGSCRLYHFNELKPIPITEELILKAGFEKYKKYKFHYIAEIGRQTFEVIYYTNGWRVKLEELNLVDLDYFHQLQNVIFSLTGEELSI